MPSMPTMISICPEIYSDIWSKNAQWFLKMYMYMNYHCVFLDQMHFKFTDTIFYINKSCDFCENLMTQFTLIKFFSCLILNCNLCDSENWKHTSTMYIFEVIYSVIHMKMNFKKLGKSLWKRKFFKVIKSKA